MLLRLMVINLYKLMTMTKLGTLAQLSIGQEPFMRRLVILSGSALIQLIAQRAVSRLKLKFTMGQAPSGAIPSYLCVHMAYLLI